MKTIALIPLLLAAAGAWAKLPPPSDEARAKAAEVAARAAHGGKVEAYKLCLAMDKVAAGYQASAKKAGRAVPAPTATPACADPGAFVATAAAPAPPAATPATPAAKK